MEIIAALLSFFMVIWSFVQTILPPGFDDIFNGGETVLEENMTPEQLQKEYDFIYYEDVANAFNDVNSGAIGTNAIDATNDPETEKGAGVYINADGLINIVALADNYINGCICVYKDVTLNLGGHKLYFTMTSTGFDIRNTTEDPDDIVTVNINGRIDGGAIQVDYDNAVAIANYADTVVNISEGEYIARSSCRDVDENCLAPNGHKYQTRTLFCAADAEMNVSDAEILTSIDCGYGYGIANLGILNIENSRIFADAAYCDDGTNYIYMSIGIQNMGVATVKNCDVTGTHSGISSSGTLYVDGGTYQSIGHGGVYVSGNGKTSYIQNATLKACEYEGAYNVSPETSNNTGFYVGGSLGQDNLVVYIDNCDFYGDRAPFALRGTDGEQNNSIYISNSRISGDSKIRIDNDTHRLYLGKGNAFTAENITRPSRVFVTEDVYHADF